MLLKRSVLVLLISSGCSRIPAAIDRFEPAYAVQLTVVNNSMREGSIEFRVDGVQLLDTIVPRGGIPALVLHRQIRLTAGKHRLQLFDKHLRQGHEIDFVVKPSEMTIELTLRRDRSTIRAVYYSVGYM